MNIKNLGTPYRVMDDIGNDKEVLIIEKSEFFDLVKFPQYNYEEDYAVFLDRCKRSISGNDFNFKKVWWHSTTVRDYDLHEVIECCLYDDFDLVIIDFFETEDFLGDYK